MSVSDRYMVKDDIVTGEAAVVHNPDYLSPHQKAVYDEISFPRKTKVLYRVLKNKMPDSSVRRILYTLRDKGLARQMDNKKWLRI